MDKIPWRRVSLDVGIILLLFGLQMRAVEHFVLSPQSTSLLSRYAGPGVDTTHGAVQQIVVDTTGHSHTVTPPRWIGWALLSTGGVLFVHGLLGHWRKR
jgi:hypothetical protein